jgi:4-amino-4-deoxy-L-arabinose transferase-like glycosyltransferase
VLPSADLYRLITNSHDDALIISRFGRSVDTSKLVRFLKANRNGETYLLATATTHLAAPIIINTGEAILVRGGFHGLNPALPVEKLARMVETKQVRFVMTGDAPAVSRKMGAAATEKFLTDWVRSNGKLVDSPLWRSLRRSSSMELFDLRPGISLVATPAVAGREVSYLLKAH